MHLAKIEVNGFRSLTRLELHLAPGLNVLAGRNNIGKTNLLAALRLALGPAASRGDTPWLSRDDFHRPAIGADPALTMTVSLTFEALEEAERAQFFEIVDFNLQDPAASTAIINFEASWPKGQRAPKVDRWGGPLATERSPIPAEILAAIPITFLPALRDAEAALAPGARSRLALLLRELVDRVGGGAEAGILEIFENANRALENQRLVQDVQERVQETTRSMSGSDYSASTIRASEVEIDRVLRTLRVQMAGQPIGDLALSGLGYNNLLYIAVVLEHLRNLGDDESPILLVEEPEAHLHPQLTLLLARYLSGVSPADKRPQTLVTTHSPVLAASVEPKRVIVLDAGDPAKGPRAIRACSLRRLGMEAAEERAVQRMMDVTRAVLYFAKGVILVEGVSEAILVPVVAARLGVDLAQEHVSVLPICGVSFPTFRKLLGAKGLGIPVAVVSDADPPVEGARWESEAPRREADGSFCRSDRANSLLVAFDANGPARVFLSQVTLEYDLAAAGDENPLLMTTAWESTFTRPPGTLNRARLEQAGTTREERALCVWRGICRASHTGSKAEFAQALALALDSRNEDGNWSHRFEVPGYLARAIRHVTGKTPEDMRNGGMEQVETQPEAGQ